MYPPDPVNDFDLTGEFVPLLVAAIYVGGIAWSAYDAHKDPSPGNMAGLGLAFIPGGGTLSKAPKVVGAVAKLKSVPKAVAKGKVVARRSASKGWSGSKSVGRKISPLHGQEFKVGQNFRVKPLGHWKGKSAMERLPHYHLRKVDKKTKTTKPGGGIGKHRPWQGW